MTTKDHRELNTILIIILFISIGLNSYMIKNNTHSLEQCEVKLFEKLTNHKAPKGIR